MAVTTVNKKPIMGRFGRTDLYAIGVGQVIGAGIVTYTVTCMKMTGYSAWLAYLIAILLGFVMILPNLLASKVVRVSGGFYSIVSSTMGATGSGMFAYVFVLSILGMSMFIRSTTEYLGDLIPMLNDPTAKIIFGVILIGFFLFVHLMGMNIFAKVQKAMVWVLIACLGMFIAFGLPKIHLPIFDFSDPNFMINGIFKFNDSGVLTGGLFLATFSFIGSTYGYGSVLGYGGQTKDPKKDMAPAMVLGFITILVLYTLVAFVATGCMTLEEYGSSTTLVFVARQILPGPLFYVFIIGGPVMALLTTINASFAAASIAIAKSAEDGWFPKFMAKKNKHGAFQYPLYVVTLFSLIPTVFGFNIAQLLAYLGPVTSTPIIIYLIGFALLPRKFPHLFDKKSGVSKKAYLTACIVALVVQLAMFSRGVLASPWYAILISLVLILVFICAGIYRSKKGNITLYTGVWDVDEPAELTK